MTCFISSSCCGCMED